jgi:hypothetical protein
MVMQTVFKALRAVERRPGMYLGGDDNDHVQRLRGLELWLFGFQAALRELDVGGAGQHFLRDFAAYLRRRYGWSDSIGAIGAVLREVPRNQVWETFWLLVHEFEAEVATTDGAS